MIFIPSYSESVAHLVYWPAFVGIELLEWLLKDRNQSPLNWLNNGWQERKKFGENDLNFGIWFPTCGRDLLPPHVRGRTGEILNWGALLVLILVIIPNLLLLAIHNSKISKSRPQVGNQIPKSKSVVPLQASIHNLYS